MLQEIAKIGGVRGLLLFDARGAVIYRERRGGAFEDPSGAPWWPPFVASLTGLRGLEALYAGGRIYIRPTPDGYLLILMDAAAPTAMIRLNCDVFLHGQERSSAKPVTRGFFRRRG